MKCHRRATNRKILSVKYLFVQTGIAFANRRFTISIRAWATMRVALA